MDEEFGISSTFKAKKRNCLFLDCLESESNEILMNDETIKKARKSVEKMAEIGR